MKLMWKRTLGILSFIICMSAMQIGCIGENNKNQQQNMTLKEIKVIAEHKTLPYYSSSKLTAEGTFTDGKTRDITNEVDWTTDKQGMTIEKTADGVKVISKILDSVEITATSRGRDKITGKTVIKGVALVRKITRVFLIDLADPAIKIGSTKNKLAVTAELVDGSKVDNLSAGIKFTASESNIVQINEANVLAKGVGTTTVIASTADDAKSDPFKISVIPYRAYALGNEKGNGKIYILDQNFESGNLTSNKVESSIDTRNNPTAMVFDSLGKHAYVLSGDQDRNGISIYNVNSITGALTDTKAAVCEKECDGALSLSFAPSGKFAYVVKNMPNIIGGSASIIMYNVDQKSGALSYNSEGYRSIGEIPRSFTFDPSGKYAYVLDKNADGINVISAFTVDQSTGYLTTLNAFPIESGAISMKFDLNGHYLYVVTTSASIGQVLMFSQDGKGELHKSNTIAGTWGKEPTNISFASGKTSNYAYVVNSATKNLATYIIE